MLAPGTSPEAKMQPKKLVAAANTVETPAKPMEQAMPCLVLS
jgi:hypothetical protein